MVIKSFSDELPFLCSRVRSFQHHVAAEEKAAGCGVQDSK